MYFIQCILRQNAFVMYFVRVRCLIRLGLHLPGQLVFNFKLHYFHEIMLLSARLLGSGAASDVLQLTNNLAGGGQARFNLISSDELRFFSRGGGGGTDDDQFEDLFQVSLGYQYNTVKLMHK